MCIYMISACRHMGTTSTFRCQKTNSVIDPHPPLCFKLSLCCLSLWGIQWSIWSQSFQKWSHFHTPSSLESIGIKTYYLVLHKFWGFKLRSQKVAWQSLYPLSPFPIPLLCLWMTLCFNIFLHVLYFTYKHCSYYYIRWCIHPYHHYPKWQGINSLLHFSFRDKILMDKVPDNISQYDKTKRKNEAGQSLGVHYTKRRHDLSVLNNCY